MGFSGLECSHKPTLPEKPYFFTSVLAKVLIRELVIESEKAAIKLDIPVTRIDIDLPQS
jgi:hypothetical protein